MASAEAILADWSPPPWPPPWPPSAWASLGPAMLMNMTTWPTRVAVRPSAGPYLPMSSNIFLP